ncbi:MULTISPECIES: FG-GAP-like repeat-containing protein [unclassified Streptomyces]|uniref:FG-GAP-like repeat-containing protein n=1 Tax=unclassified Streptomyces TaxID=2593676 RepID=UPI0023663B64|nr:MULTISPECIES: FG-GAP-like repeat-containing protein [unclassified Streptomyces]MDF3148326.1 FG-GAP-like repeat-containing protein [Streptomyces sp. T21Q-yed]WDF39479.1 FG-GAP-like repeat-containing protein [Streptomyces sp. T12]
MRRAVTAAAVLTASVAVTLTPVTSSAAAPYKGANTAAVQDDFNGDGYRDLAVGAPYATNGSVEAAGSVVVLYGSASSVSATRRTVVTQATTGIPGDAEELDRFGTAVTSADLDRDGYADLIVGTPGEDVGTKQLRGSVTVVWGGPDGLKGGANIAPPAGYGDGMTLCGFGMSLATGDMNGDGAPELSIGSRCEGASYTGPFTRTGRAASAYREWRTGETRGVVMGDVDGDGRAERFWLAGPTSGDLRGPVHLDNGAPHEDSLANWPTKLPYADGHTGVIGDVNGDGYGDLVTGIAADDSLAGGTGAAHRGGEIQVLFGSAQGITADQKPKVYQQDTAGVPGTAENGDRFGQSLSIGDVNGDKYADVLVGSPGEGIGTQDSAGAVVLLRGSASGLTTARAAGYSQNTSDVPGTAETEDEFGTAVHIADLNKDGRPETVVGIPGENSDGCVWIARGSASGPVLSGSVSICGKSTGITVRGFKGHFGAALTGPHVER